MGFTATQNACLHCVLAMLCCVRVLVCSPKSSRMSLHRSKIELVGWQGDFLERLHHWNAGTTYVFTSIIWQIKRASDAQMFDASFHAEHMFLTGKNHDMCLSNIAASDSSPQLWLNWMIKLKRFERELAHCGATPRFQKPVLINANKSNTFWKQSCVFWKMRAKSEKQHLLRKSTGKFE